MTDNCRMYAHSVTHVNIGNWNARKYFVVLRRFFCSLCDSLYMFARALCMHALNWSIEKALIIEWVSGVQIDETNVHHWVLSPRRSENSLHSTAISLFVIEYWMTKSWRKINENAKLVYFRYLGWVNEISPLFLPGVSLHRPLGCRKFFKYSKCHFPVMTTIGLLF